MNQQPNLYREFFPYDEVPKIIFDDSYYKRNLPEDIWITDTTFRDGQQSMSTFTKKQIVTLFDYMHKIDNGAGVIRQTEFFLYNPHDRHAVEACRDRGYDFPQITSWIRATKNDFELVKSMEISETGILMSCSDYHIFHKMGWDRDTAMKNYLEILEAALASGVKPRCHFEDITRADIHGFVLPLAKKINELGNQAGVKVKIRSCDTLGLGLPYNGAALPRSVPGIISLLQREAGFSSDQLEWHGHNDYHAAVTNSTTAWLYGCAAISTTLLGIGERTGNTPLDGMLVEYMQLKGPSTLNLHYLSELADYFEKEMHYTISVKHPYIGIDFNSTKAGIHADGILKNEEVYNSFNTEKILNRPILIQVNEYSGVAGVAAWINCYFKLKGDDKVKKTDEGVKKIKDAIDVQYKSGRASGMTNEELRALVVDFLPQVCDID